mmetsp:Transcript_35401/g.100245  ORF Transcript_35401/g.100245 Transcript_35401/m.100245 type:complete len:123 (+) Transcript_35401:55-423(+)|eukprot:CAMPEP_0117648174 /NCGR_PEP_ID=MMETSP0804-20121206/249_1 /TAXON_ID=1074897 /ORGANISM="Tetraselmis astigmatica, Strain CCMP880" /LENGTH=122 /DNA_ID=CAMNT_0005453729 /DNA_START=43 /DNA_END=411 /DNA_ORIENTATION=-
MNLCLTHPPPSLFLSHCMFLSLAIKTRVAEVCGNRGGEAVKNQLKKASPLPHHATLCLGVQVLSDIQSRMLSPTSSDAAQQSLQRHPHGVNKVPCPLLQLLLKLLPVVVLLHLSAHSQPAFF